MYKKEEITDVKQQRWIEQQHYDPNKKLKANKWAGQFKLSSAIALLQQKAGLYNETIAAYHFNS